MAYLWEAVYGVLAHLSGVFPTEQSVSYPITEPFILFPVLCLLIG